MDSSSLLNGAHGWMVRFTVVRWTDGCNFFRVKTIDSSKNGFKNPSHFVSYLTSLPPSVGKRRIVETCWGPGAYPQLVRQGRVDYVIRVRLPSNRVKKAKGTKREVYLHLGDLILVNYNWDNSKVP